MGGCSSCDSRSGFSTAKLILQNGQLLEFSGPVKVSHLLQKNPGSFLCNSDDMDFDDVVSPVGADEFLHPGQLYFILPLNRLHRPLSAPEMAALAVKANLALAGSGCETNGRRAKGSPAGLTAVESDFNEMKTCREIGSGGGMRKNTKNLSQTSGRTRWRNTAAVLSAIPE